jgi:hypothetical protein
MAARQSLHKLRHNMARCGPFPPAVAAGRAQQREPAPSRAYSPLSHVRVGQNTVFAEQRQTEREFLPFLKFFK